MSSGGYGLGGEVDCLLAGSTHAVYGNRRDGDGEAGEHDGQSADVCALLPGLGDGAADHVLYPPRVYVRPVHETAQGVGEQFVRSYLAQRAAPPAEWCAYRLQDHRLCHNGAPFSAVYYGKCNATRTLRIMEYPLVGHLRVVRVGVVFPGVQVPFPARKRTRCDLHPDAVSGQKREAGRPEVYRVFVDFTGFYRARFDRVYDARSRVALPGAGPNYSVRYSYRAAVGVDVHEPDDEVRVRG